MAVADPSPESGLDFGTGKGVLLVSGGPDSATLAYWAKEMGFDVCAIHFKQGLKTDRQELLAAETLSTGLGMPFEVFDISQMIGILGGKRAMIHSEVAALRFGTAMCLSPAVIFANEWGADRVLLALHAEDSLEGPEYRRHFLDPFEQSARAALSSDMRILTPFLEISKSEVLKIGVNLGVQYQLTWSCINGDVVHCGLCGACRARQRAFATAALQDPTEYGETLFAESAAHGSGEG
ncbi:MAG: 7-cyano-7-deazaguanine synthase [Acidimicrobiia bacterium]